MLTATSSRVAALATSVAGLILVFTASLSPQGLNSTFHDFNAAAGTPYAAAVLPAGGAAAALMPGGATDAGRFLRLAYEQNAPSHNSIAFDRTAAGAFDVIVLDFDFRVTLSDTRADGLGVALARTTAYGTAGPLVTTGLAEEPNLTGSVGIGFDVYKSGAEVSDNHVSIHFNGTKRAEFDVTESIDLAGGRWIHARIILRPGAGLRDVTVILTPFGGSPRTVVNAYQIPDFTPYEGRVYFAARSGGASADHDLDNVIVNFLGATQSLVSFAGLVQFPVENASPATVSITRALNTSGTASVQFQTIDLSATSPTDYVATSGTVTFDPGETTKSISIPLVNDATQETGEERFLVRLTNATGAMLAGPPTTAVFIVDDEDARVRGYWSAPIDLPIIPIHLHLLPSGKLLFFEGRGEQMGGMTFTELRSWDPATGVVTQPGLPGYDIFCSGHSLLSNGMLLVTGGHAEGDNGLPHASVFVPEREAWVQLADMNAPRWYPTNTTLANGDVLVVNGNITATPPPAVRNQLPQVFDVARWAWRSLTGADKTPPGAGDLYPRMFLGPDGRVFKAGPDEPTGFLDTTGTGTWTPSAQPRIVTNRDYGSAVMFDSTVLLIGGGGQDPASTGPTASAERLDLNSVSAGWRSSGTMQFARRHNNATLLPTGRVLVTGGTSSPGWFNAAGAVLTTELWTAPQDPAGMGTWATLASMSIKRVYHSTALLLPDGRVVSGGAGQPESVGDVDHRNVEIFSPPYLFEGPRPTITSAPASAKYGETIPVQTPDAGVITKVTMVRLGSVTHAFDQNQRLVTLPFTASGGVVSARLPSSPNLAPPGHYMLFLLNGGIPSIARIVRVNGFTDDPIVPGSTVARAAHIVELRARINLLRVRFGLAPFAWTDPVLTVGSTAVRAIHITDLRTALAQASTAAEQGTPTYTDPPPVAANAPISAIHINELRSRVLALE